MLKNDFFFTFKKICSIEIFQKIELERYNFCLELYKRFKKIHRRKRKIFVFVFEHFYACDVILSPHYN